jgi:O-antigen ligase
MIRTESGQIEAKSAFLLLALVILTCLGGFLVAKVSIFISLLIVTIFILVVVSFLSAETALYLLIASMLLSPEFMMGDLLGKGTGGRGITIRFDDILLVIIGIGWFAKTALKKDLGLFLKTPLNRPITYYIVICVISTLIGFAMGRVNLKTGLFYIIKYFEFFIIYFMAANHLRDKEQIKRFVAAMLVVCVVICIVAMLQIPAGGRVTAPFEGEAGEPNTLGGYLVLMFSITLGLLVTSDSMKRKTFLGILTVLIAIPLLATLSRSSWLAMGPMLLALIYFSRRKMVIIVPLVIFVLVTPFIMPKAVRERALYTVTQQRHIEQLEIGGVRIDTSTSARLVTWKEVLTRDFVKHPLFGYGVTGYAFVDAQYPKVLIETGILGLIAFLSLLFFIYKNALSTYRNTSDPFFSGISLGYLAGFIAMVVHAIGTNTFIIVRIMEPFWFLTAIIIMIPTIEGGGIKNETR